MSKFLKRFVKDGFVKWCNSDGQPFETDTALKKAKYAGRAFIAARSAGTQSSATLLPNAYEITGDEAWKDGGELTQQYDLALD